MKKIERARAAIQKTVLTLTPSASAWRGATTALYLFVIVVTTAFFAIYFVQDFSLQKLPAFLVRVGSIFLIGFAVLLALSLVNRIPLAYRIALLVFAPFALLAVSLGDDKEKLLFSAAILLFVSFMGAGAAVLREEGFRPGRQKVSLIVLGLGSLGLIGGLFAIFSDKGIANPALTDYVLQDRTLDLPNPGLPGDYDVLTFTYGSGNDKQRQEFGDGADIVSRTVDASKLIDNWEGVSGWLRSSYWGFDVAALPLQARVWYPDGDGPFPLVLIVHGNHSMEDFSDPGYAYLGELFASRGTIFASVDENFINSSISAAVDPFADRPGLEEENDARGWLLLQHLDQWRDWNSEAGHRFQNQIDIDRVALIGHSRGGEAVGIAAAFNSLDRYPDDATLDFDFGFNLRGVIAIAPVYGQYKPRDKYTPIKNVNYFTIHGDMDGDVQSFEGMAQYSRVTFTDESPFRFRSGLYVVGANHGQFNTTWGNLDTTLFRAWALDLDGLMDGEAQRDVARVYFSAFMEVVLNNRVEYLQIFRDARFAQDWLPTTFFLNQFSSSAEQVLADFEEDIDPATLTRKGGRITAKNFSKWYEKANSLKQDNLDTHSVVLAWDRRFFSEAAEISFQFAPANLGVSGLLNASISSIDIDTTPKDKQGKEENEEAPEKDEPLDWTIEVLDSNGSRASLPLSHDSKLFPLINALPRRASFVESEEPSEVLFRRFEFPITDFVETNTTLDPTSISGIRFVFDRSKRGSIAIDDISFTVVN